MLTSVLVILSFLPTHPLRGATAEQRGLKLDFLYFYPRTPCGVRRKGFVPQHYDATFLPTHPLRGATGRNQERAGRHHISTHAPLAGCDARGRIFLCAGTISTHAPLAGCDKAGAGFRGCRRHFYPRTPCGVRQLCKDVNPFLKNFYPRTPCGVRPWESNEIGAKEIISTHAPLAGCDRKSRGFGRIYRNFYPRTPCGVRRPARDFQRPVPAFLPTHPLRGATSWGVRYSICWKFLPTHPLRGATKKWFDMIRHGEKFLPTHPLRGATRKDYDELQKRKFLPTHPLRGATRFGACRVISTRISTHAPLAGCDPRTLRPTGRTAQFLPTHPLRGATDGTHRLAFERNNFYPRTPCGVRLSTAR